MSRPRKHNTGLPDYVRIKNGAYHYRGKKLCRVDAGERSVLRQLPGDLRCEHLSTTADRCRGSRRVEPHGGLELAVVAEEGFDFCVDESVRSLEMVRKVRLP